LLQVPIYLFIFHSTKVDDPKKEKKKKTKNTTLLYFHITRREREQDKRENIRENESRVEMLLSGYVNVYNKMSLMYLTKHIHKRRKKERKEKKRVKKEYI
jgi:hypothetical protein